MATPTNFLDLLLAGEGSNPLSTSAVDPTQAASPDPLQLAQASGQGLGLSSASQQATPLPTPTVQPAQPVAQQGNTLENFGNALLGLSAGIGGRGGSFLAQQALLGQRGTKLDAKTIQSQGVQGIQKAIKSVIDVSNELTGENRKQALVNGAAQLNNFAPGAGDVLTNLAKKPGLAELVVDNAQNSQTLQSLTAIDPSGRLALKLLSTTDGAKTVAKEIETQKLPAVRQKVRGIVSQMPILADEELSKRILSDRTVSQEEFHDLNEIAKTHPDKRFQKLALSDADFLVANNNEEATFGTAGVLTAAKSQELLTSKAKEGAEPGKVIKIGGGGKKELSVAFDPEGTFFPDAPHDKNGFAILGEKEAGGTTIQNFPSSSGFGEFKGQLGRFSVGRDGKVRFDPELKPVPKQRTAREDLLFNLLPGLDPENKNKTEKKSLDAIPPEVQAEFAADPSMKNNTLGKFDPRKGGFEVRDKTGGVIGHWPL